MLGLRRLFSLIPRVVVFLEALLPMRTNADNPCIPIARSTADPAPSVFNDTLFLYCTRDNDASLSISNIDCYGTVDLVNWINYGPVLTEAAVTWDNNAGHLWAPHVVYFGGKYHLYYPETSSSGIFYIGHAVNASSPHTPFTPDPQPITINGSRTGSIQDNALDPFVIMDTGAGGSGKNYIAWCITGITPNRNYIGELNANGDAVTGAVQLRNADFYPEGGHYVEGQWWIKANSTWYHIYAVYYPGGAEQIGCATTTGSLTGSYTFRGFLMGTNQNSAAGTIHPGCAYFRPAGAAKPSWILFWHCGGEEFGGSLLSGSAMRSSGAEYFTFNGTGANAPIISTLYSNAPTWQIPKTYRGVGVPRAGRAEAVGDTIHVDRRSNITDRTYAISGASVTRVLTPASDLGHVVTNIGSGAWVRYDSVNFTPAPNWRITAVRARVSATSSRTIEVRQGTQTGKLLATINVTSTGSLNTYSTTEAAALTTNPDTGIASLTLVFPGGSANTLNVNWVQFVSDKVSMANTAADAPSSKGFLCKRINKNAFRLDLPDQMPVNEALLLNMKGQETARLITRTEHGSVLVRIETKKPLSYGTYVLKIKSGLKTFEHTFIY